MRVEELTDKVVVITGASSGIGRATAHLAASRGAHVVLIARGEDALDRTAAECERAGAASVLTVSADVGVDGDVEKALVQVRERHEVIDAVVSNAGVVSYGRTEEVPAEVFDGVLRTNLHGAVNIARHVVPVLREQGHGSLLYVGSVIGHIAVPSMSAYTLSKWGVRVLARQLQLENRDLDGVHIGYVAPGGVATPIYQQAANYDGYQGRPPPPVASPDHVARQIVARLGRSRVRDQLGPVNDVIRFGFSAMPWAYDLLVGPLYRLMSIDLSQPLPATTGNVLHSEEPGNAVSGGHRGEAFSGIARNAGVLVRRALGRGPQPGPEAP